jgi:DNA-binding MarR family transcriptional regulator
MTASAPEAGRAEVAPNDVEAILDTSRAVLAVVARSMVEMLEHVTLPQYRVLVLLCEYGPLRAGTLAERIGIHQSTFTRTADRLVGLGFIRREVSPESRREIVVHLTDEGRKLVIAVMSSRRAQIETILADASAEERSRIRQGLQLFAQLSGEPSASDLVTVGL